MDLKLQYPSKDLIAVLAAHLSCLDISASDPGMNQNQWHDHPDTVELKKDYKALLSRFLKIGQVTDMVLIHSLILAKRTFKSAFG